MLPNVVAAHAWIGTLMVRATKDADNRIHPMSVSHLLAAESMLGVGAHISAEKMLFDIASDKERVSIVDGGAALVGQTKSLLPNCHILRCSRHLLDELSKGAGQGRSSSSKKRRRDPSGGEEDEDEAEETENVSVGRASYDCYRQIYFLGKPGKDVIEKRLMDLPESSPLNRIPKEQLCQAMLGEGGHSHGVTTNNFAEVTNCMLLPLRSETSLFRTMLHMEKFLRQRQQLISSYLIKARGGATASSSTNNGMQEWRDGVPPVPAVEQAEAAVRAMAKDLNEPKIVEGADGEITYVVESRSGGLMKTSKGKAGKSVGRGYAHHVNLEAMLHGLYDEACTCGMTGCRPICCSHYKRALMLSRGNWRRFLKPWLTMQAWEKQCGECWQPITAQMLLGKASELEAAGKLLRLRQLACDVGTRGRPTKELSKDAEMRAKSFMEETNEALAFVTEVLNGASRRSECKHNCTTWHVAPPTPLPCTHV